MRNAHDVIAEVGKEFGERFGRSYGFFETYRLDDADVAIVVLSSTAGTARVVVDQLREEGLKVGLLKPRVFRPFPAKEIAEALDGLQAVAVMDRSDSFGAQGGPLFTEVVAALALNGVNVPIVDYIFGLGGRDTPPAQIEKVYRDLLEIAETGEIDRRVTYLGVREESPEEAAVPA
jgi:pyruvate ferredoxin oxidoreductase alpha subunit